MPRGKAGAKKKPKRNTGKPVEKRTLLYKDKRCWMKAGDVLLVSRRDYQMSKVDVIYKYTDEETRALTKTHEIPEFFLDLLLCSNKNEDDNFIWDDEGDDEEDRKEEEYNISEKLSYEDIHNMISSSEDETE